jgi:hypothetical protein
MLGYDVAQIVVRRTAVHCTVTPGLNPNPVHQMSETYIRKHAVGLSDCE